jgi:hypothetical protein
MLRERVEAVLARAEHAYGDEEFVRLAALSLALLDRHRVDDKGRCRYCRSGRKWWRRRGRCVVVVCVAYYLEQPTGVVLSASQF